MNGFIKSFNTNDGKGSISPREEKRELIHFQSDLNNVHMLDLKPGDRVSFDIIKTDGMMSAINITKSVIKKLPLF